MKIRAHGMSLFSPLLWAISGIEFLSRNVSESRRSPTEIHRTTTYLGIGHNL